MHQQHTWKSAATYQSASVESQPPLVGLEAVANWQVKTIASSITSFLQLKWLTLKLKLKASHMLFIDNETKAGLCCITGCQLSVDAAIGN